MRRAADPIEVALDVSAVPARPAGAGRYIIELARELAKRHDCGLTLLSRRDDAPRWAEIAPGRRLVALAPVHRLGRLLYEQLRFSSVVAGLRSPSVAVHHGPHYTMPRRSKLPCVVTVHDMTFFDHPEWHEATKVAWFRSAIRYSARHATAIVCVSETTAGRLSELLSPRCPVAVIPHGVDHSRFVAAGPTLSADRELLASLGLRAPYLLHLGTLEPRKGIVDLVAAFDLLADARPDLELVLAGATGWKAAPALAAIANARAAERIRRLGYVSDEAVPALLRGARAVVYPSLEEGFGLPALEALACGAPLVTTTGTAMAELAGASAVLAPPRRPDALAEAIEAACESESAGESQRRRKLGLEIAARHTWRACAESHLSLYRQAAGA